MLSSFRFFTLALVFIGVSACDTILDVDLPKDEVRVVLNAALASDTGISLSVSQSTDILDPETEYQQISNANIRLFKDDIALSNLQNLGDGQYYFDHRPAPGSAYRIEVDASSYPDLSSEFTMPEREELKAIDTTRTIVQGFFSSGREEYPALDLQISDRPGPHYYTTKAEVEVALLVYLDVFFVDTVYLKTPIGLNSDDPLLGEGAETFGTGDLVFNDELFESSEYSLNVFYFDLYTEEEDPKDFIDLEDEDLIQAIQNLGFTTDDIRVEYGPKWIYLSFGSMSRELYEYEISRTLQNGSSNNPFSQPVQVSNNIENGFGVFGGISYTEYKLRTR